MKDKLNAAFVGVGAFLGKQHLPNAFRNPIFKSSAKARPHKVKLNARINTITIFFFIPNPFL